MIYANGVSVSTQLTKQLQTISSSPESDRKYINAQFLVVSPEKSMTLIAEGLSREDILDKFRKSDRYEIIKGIHCFCYYKYLIFVIYQSKYLYSLSDLYEHRVRLNGKGDLNDRLSLFKLTFRTKLNNWWTKNAPKNVAEVVKE